MCQDNNIEILLINMPTAYEGEFYGEERSEFKGYWNAVADIADEYSVEYLNFMYHWKEIELDLSRDTDGGVHLNVYGAHKFTKYLGKYIKDHYSIPDVRDNSEYSHMEQDYLEFVAYLDRIRNEREWE